MPLNPRVILLGVASVLAVLPGCTSTAGSVQMTSSDLESTATPLCEITVSRGYPVGRRCNAAARAIPEFVGCEVDNLNDVGALHDVPNNLPPDQISWWCQSENATPLVVKCEDETSAIPGDDAPEGIRTRCGVHLYPGIAVYNKRKAIQVALSSGVVPSPRVAPDGQRCPNSAGGDLGGVADMDGQDGPVVNWLANPLTDRQMYNAFMDGDFNNVNARVPFYQGACFRPATHTVFLAQGTLVRQEAKSPNSGCPTPHDPFALDGNGKPDLRRLNSLRQDVGCDALPNNEAGRDAERQACLGILADEHRIQHDGIVGLFPMSFVFVQLERQFAAFRGLLCHENFGLTDLDPQRCDTRCTNQACSPECAGACGLCNGSNLSCSQAGSCVASCLPMCTGKTCGDDGCGGSCGTCAAGQVCQVGGTCAAAVSAPVKFSTDVLPVLANACSGCHQQGKLDFDFTANVMYQNLVNARSKSCAARLFVIPGNSRESYLMDKLTPLLGLCAGGSMRSSLTDPQVQLVKDWIDQGALNN